MEAPPETLETSTTQSKQEKEEQKKWPPSIFYKRRWTLPEMP